MMAAVPQSNLSVTPSITILLATFNGELFIQQQLESLVGQTHRRWRLCARDDGSTDGTVRVLREAARRDPRIHVLEPDGQRLGSSGNFGALLDWALDSWADPYVMFCDQDDVWRPEKIEVSLGAMRRLEAEVGASTPVLVHTDFEFVDTSLTPLGSLDTVACRLSRPEQLILNRLLSQNFIYGCTMMLNRALVEASAPIPDTAAQHDYWVALVAAAIGRIVRVPIRTVFYRQHDSNVTPGLRSAVVSMRLRRLLTGWPDAARLNRARNVQAQTLALRLSDRLPAARRRLLDEYLSAMGRGGIRAAWFAYRYGLRRQGPLQTARYLVSLLATRPGQPGRLT